MRFLAALVVLFCGFSLHAQENQIQRPSKSANQSKRSDYVSDASFVIGTYQPAENGQSSEQIAQAANKFLASLDAKQLARVQHDLKSPERRRWTNLPAPGDAGGVRLGDMNEKQVKASCDLLAALLSKKGYKKMCDIMLADDQLLNGNSKRPGFGTENFSIVIFGKPSATEPWGFQLDGHHVGLNVSLAKHVLTLSPSFIGTQPEAFKIANKEFRPLDGETDLAYKLIDSLSDDQKRKAIIHPRRAQIVTGPGTDGKVPKAKGVSCSTFSATQKQILISLITQWIENYPAAHGAMRLHQLSGEIDKMKFAWNGPTANRSDVSFTIQGPTIIIEFACQQRGANPLDHLHTMYRDPTNEYAGQLDD